MAAFLVCIDQRPPAFSRAWFFAWGIKLYQLCRGMSWRKARYNHVGILCEVHDVIIELDGKAHMTSAFEYQYTTRKNDLLVQLQNEAQVVVRSIQMVSDGAKYNWRYNLRFIPVLRRFFRNAEPHNCVSFAVRCLGGDWYFESYLPGQFLK